MSGGTLDLAGNAQTVGGLSGTAGTVGNSGSGTPVLTVNGGGTFGGKIVGGVALTKSGQRHAGPLGRQHLHRRDDHQRRHPAVGHRPGHSERHPQP